LKTASLQPIAVRRSGRFNDMFETLHAAHVTQQRTHVNCSQTTEKE